MKLGERSECLAQEVAGGGFENDFPGKTAVGAFVEGGHWRGNDEGRGGSRREFGEGLVGGADFGESGFFGLISDSEASKVGERWELLAAAFAEEVAGEGSIVGGESGADGGMVGLIGLDDDLGAGKVTAPNSAYDLREQVIGPLFGCEIG